ncbi:hypothetical protein V6Z11_D08G184400 [Gossypium hirsutum]
MFQSSSFFFIWQIEYHFQHLGASVLLFPCMDNFFPKLSDWINTNITLSRFFLVDFEND